MPTSPHHVEHLVCEDSGAGNGRSQTDTREHVLQFWQCRCVLREHVLQSGSFSAFVWGRGEGEVKMSGCKMVQRMATRPWHDTLANCIKKMCVCVCVCMYVLCVKKKREFILSVLSMSPRSIESSLRVRTMLLHWEETYVLPFNSTGSKGLRT